MKKDIGKIAAIYPTPVLVVGSYDKDLKPNIMTIGTGAVVSLNPILVSISLRKATLTYDNIMENMAFTINIPSEKYVKEVDYIGIVSGHKADKFAKTGLTAVMSQNIKAPYIEEFLINLECNVTKIVELGMHTQFIGEVVNTIADEEAFGESGEFDLGKIKPLAYAISAKKSDYYGISKKVGCTFSDGKILME
jgi:flavin reductase (DIM6/NTAB) family NADH-FMN oxidoreductase RutF